jgi:nucleoside-diphosphate-sugar epimerase
MTTSPHAPSIRTPDTSTGAGTALILGASGMFGRNAADAFGAAGWTVRAFDRARDDMNEAARGADVIVNALNPPAYKGWATVIPAITESVIAAARAGGATVIVPGNVYPFGDTPGSWSEDTPHRPTSKKGHIRAAMEARYRQAADELGVRTVILRAGDFIDARPANGWMDIVAKAVGQGRLTYPGRPDTEHAWAYLPDMARAAAALAGRRASLAAFEDIPFPGLTLTGEAMRAHAEAAFGAPVALRGMPWWAIRAASPVWRLGRELLEMRYLWRVPHSLSGEKFGRLLPDFESTPAREVLAQVVAARVGSV